MERGREVFLSSEARNLELEHCLPWGSGAPGTPAGMHGVPVRLDGVRSGWYGCRQGVPVAILGGLNLLCHNAGRQLCVLHLVSNAGSFTLNFILLVLIANWEIRRSIRVPLFKQLGEMHQISAMYCGRLKS